MKLDKIEQLQDYLYDIEALVIAACDSCEHNMYTTQFLTLRIIKKYLSKVFRLLDE